jgi:hypothetical protein
MNSELTLQTQQALQQQRIAIIKKAQAQTAVKPKRPSDDGFENKATAKKKI